MVMHVSVPSPISVFADNADAAQAIAILYPDSTKDAAKETPYVAIRLGSLRNVWRTSPFSAKQSEIDSLWDQEICAPPLASTPKAAFRSSSDITTKSLWVARKSIGDLPVAHAPTELAAQSCVPPFHSDSKYKVEDGVSPLIVSPGTEALSGSPKSCKTLLVGGRHCTRTSNRGVAAKTSARAPPSALTTPKTYSRVRRSVGKLPATKGRQCFRDCGVKEIPCCPIARILQPHV